MLPQQAKLFSPPILLQGSHSLRSTFATSWQSRCGSPRSLVLAWLKLLAGIFTTTSGMPAACATSVPWRSRRCLQRARSEFVFSSASPRPRPSHPPTMHHHLCLRTLSRGLVLVICMGYGMVRPTLGAVMGRVVIFCVCYFVIDSIVDFVETFNQDNITRFWAPLSKLLFLFPMAVLDVILLFWCMSSLSATLEQLERKQVRMF